MIQFRIFKSLDSRRFFPNRNDEEINEYIEYFYHEAGKSFEVIANVLLHKTTLPEKAIIGFKTETWYGLGVGIDIGYTKEACIKNNIDTSHNDPAAGFGYHHEILKSKEGNAIVSFTVLVDPDTTLPTIEIDANDPDLFPKLKKHLHTLIEIATSAQTIEDFIVTLVDEVGYERKNESSDR